MAFGLIGSAAAQSLSPGGPVDFGLQNVGTTSSTTTLTFSVNAGSVTTVGSIVAVTDGASGSDFNVASQTCVGTLAGPATCQILLNFTPSVLGLRLGELFVKDGSGNITNRVPLRGAGLGPQMVVSPATAAATTSFPAISPAAINPSSTVYDGSGNLDQRPHPGARPQRQRYGHRDAARRACRSAVLFHHHRGRRYAIYLVALHRHGL
jgi:hypothetical protein